MIAENNFESKLWELYAELMTSQENDENVTENDLFKAGQYMQKATATYMQSNKDWYKSSSSIKNGLELSSKYAESKFILVYTYKIRIHRSVKSSTETLKRL